MNTRRRILAALCGASLGTRWRIASAQTAVKVHRIGWLSSAPKGEIYGQFVGRARELGHIEGQTLLIDYRSFDTIDDGKAAAADLVRLKVDLIIAPAPPALLAARSATQSVPIVTFFVPDPVRTGIVASLARPGGNVTGFTWDRGADSTGKPLEIAKEIFPRALRVGLLWNQENDGNAFYVREYESRASEVRLELVSVGVRNPDDFVPALERMAGDKVSAVIVFADPFMVRHRPALTAALQRSRLPALWSGAAWPLPGAVLTFGPDVADQPRRAAEYMDRILRGAAPGELPFQQPTKANLVIHAKTARELGISIPRSLLVRADRVDEQ